MAELQQIDLDLLGGIIEGLIHEERVRGAILIIVDTEGNTLSYIAEGDLSFIERIGAVEITKRTLERRAEEMGEEV